MNNFSKSKYYVFSNIVLLTKFVILIFSRVLALQSGGSAVQDIIDKTMRVEAQKDDIQKQVDATNKRIQGEEDQISNLDSQGTKIRGDGEKLKGDVKTLVRHMHL